MAIDLEALKAKLKKMETGGRGSSGVSLWKPKVGKYRVRLLPWPDADAAEPFKELWFYYLNRTILAPHQFGKEDPIHEVCSQLYNSGTKEDRELAKNLRAKMRTYAPLIVKQVNEVDANDETVYAWGFGSTVYKRLLNLFFLENAGNFLDPKEGYDILVNITKQEGKSYNDTSIDLSRASTPIANSDVEIKKILAKIPNLDDMYPLLPAAEIKKILDSWLQGGSDQSYSSTSQGESRGKAPADALDDLVNEVKSKKKAEPVEEDDDLEDKPKKKKKNTRESLDAAFDDLISDED